jgi:hypothetical protein
MRIFWVLFLFHFAEKNLLQINIVNEIYKKLNLPIWHYNNIKCQSDYDCPVPFTCCNDAFFPIKDKYCCTNYKKREYKYAYNYAYVK